MTKICCLNACIVAASCVQAATPMQELTRDASASASDVQTAVKGACALALLTAAAEGPNEFSIQSPQTAVLTAVELKRGSVWLPRSAAISVIVNEARAYTLHACLWGSVEATCALSRMFVKCTSLKAHLQCTLFCQMQ